MQPLHQFPIAFINTAEGRHLVFVVSHEHSIEVTFKKYVESALISLSTVYVPLTLLEHQTNVLEAVTKAVEASYNITMSSLEAHDVASFNPQYWYFSKVSNYFIEPVHPFSGNSFDTQRNFTQLQKDFPDVGLAVHTKWLS